ncbi:replication factor [Ostertagia ostertagi]
MYSDKQRKSMVLELNASDDRGIGIVRDEIITFAQTKSLQRDKETTDLKFVILDEADAMTKDAQNALRRCTRFRFAPLSMDHILPKLNYVIAEEKLTVTEDGKQALLKLSGGDMRRVLNVLQSVAMASSTIDETTVYECCGQPTPKHIEKILQILMNDSFASCCEVKLEKECGGEGYALVDVLSRLHDVMICLISALADTEQRLAVGASDRIQIGGLVGAFMQARRMIKEAAKS